MLRTIIENNIKKKNKSLLKPCCSKHPEGSVHNKHNEWHNMHADPHYSVYGNMQCRECLDKNITGCTRCGEVVSLTCCSPVSCHSLCEKCECLGSNRGTWIYSKYCGEEREYLIHTAVKEQGVEWYREKRDLLLAKDKQFVIDLKKKEQSKQQKIINKINKW